MSFHSFTPPQTSLSHDPPSLIYCQHQKSKDGQSDVPQHASPGQHVLLAEGSRMSPLRHTPLVEMHPEDETAAEWQPESKWSVPEEDRVVLVGDMNSSEEDWNETSADAFIQGIRAASTPVSPALNSFYRLADWHGTPILTTLRLDVGPVSRPMAVARRFGPDFLFITSKETAKAADLSTSSSVKLTFYNKESHDWARVTGDAWLTSPEDRRIAECWFSRLQHWVQDLGDGTHTGKPGDPRLCCLEVKARHLVHWLDSERNEISENELAHAREMVGKRSW